MKIYFSCSCRMQVQQQAPHKIWTGEDRGKNLAPDTATLAHTHRSSEAVYTGGFAQELMVADWRIVFGESIATSDQGAAPVVDRSFDDAVNEKAIAACVKDYVARRHTIKFFSTDRDQIAWPKGGQHACAGRA